MKPHFDLLEKRGLAFLFSGNIVSMLVASIGGLFIAQIYGPRSYGEYVAILGIATILSPFLTLGLELEIPQISNEQEALDLAVTTASRVIRIGATASLPLFALAFVLRKSNTSHLFLSLALGFVLAIILAIFAIGAQINLRLRQFKTIATRGILQNTVLIFIQAALSLLSKSYLNLVIGESFGRFIGVIFILPRNFVKLVLNRIVSRKGIHQSRSRRINSWNLISQLSDNITSSFLVFAFIYLFGSSNAGSIALSLKIALLPIAIFGIPLGQMILSNSSQQVRTGNLISSGVISKANVKILVIGCISSMFIFILAPIFPTIMGDEWFGLADSIRIISIGLTFQLLWISFGSLYYVAKKWKEYAILKLINVSFLLILVFWAKISQTSILEFLYIYLVINISTQLYGLVRVFKFSYTD
jgi:O-antigen/teichoic acid export membrane protein